MNFLSAKTLVLGGALLAFAVPSHAVVLQQKWQPGQKLVYAMNMDGTASVQLPPDLPGMALFAGVPIDVQLKGDGQAALNTLSVDTTGTGKVAVSVPQMKLNMEAMAQKAQWTLQNGKSQLLLNNQPVDLGFLPQGDGKPKAALLISTAGRVTGYESLLPPAPAKAAPNAGAPMPPQAALDKAALVGAAVLGALPSLWPARDVNVGDTWQANVDFPALARPAQNGDAAKPLGNFDLKLEAQEVVNGKTLQRVTIKGDIDLDGKTLETAFPAMAPKAPVDPAPAAPAGGNARRPRAAMQPRLDHARQTVEGTLWFDATAGQVQKAALILGGRAQASTPKPNGQAGTPGWLDFTGTLNMNLQ